MSQVSVKAAVLALPPSRHELGQLLQLMWPILLTQFAQAGFGLIDTVMAGQLSAADLAAISIGVGLWLPVMLLCSGLLMATAPLVAEARGAHRLDEVATIVQQSLWIALVVGVAGAGVLWWTPVLFDLIKVPAGLQPKAGLFLHSIALGMPAVTLYTVLRAFCEAWGQPRVVTVISLLGLVVLIPFNWLFMTGWGVMPAFGGAGAGMANALLQWLMLAVLTLYILRHARFASAQIFSGFAAPQGVWLRRILALGLPIGLAIFFEVSIFSSASLIIGPLGEQMLAAHQIAMSITSQFFMIPLSLSFALTIRVGQYYGAQHWAALRQVQWIGLAVATAFALVTLTLLAIFRSDIIRLYNHDAAVFPIAYGLLAYALGYQLIDAWQVTATGCLRGLQDTRGPMWITLLAYWGVAFPLGVYLTRYAGFGAAGVWVGMISGLSVACILLVIRLYQRNHLLQRRYG